MKEIKCLIICVCLIFPLFFIIDNGSYDISVPQTCLIIVALNLLLFIRYQQKSLFRGFWYKPSNIFLISFIAVNFQYIIDLVLGFKQYSFFLYPRTVNDITIIATWGLVSFMVGYYLTGYIAKKRGFVARFNQSYYKSYTIDLTFLSIIHVAFFVFWILTADMMSIISGMSFGNETSGTFLSANFENLFYCATVAIFSSVALNSNGKNIEGIKDFFRCVNIINWVVIILYCGIRMVSGDRGPFLYTILAIFFSYVLSVKTNRIRIKWLVIPLVGLLLLVNLIGMARLDSLDQSFDQRISNAFTDYQKIGGNRFSDKTISPFTEELALSVRCNQISVEIIKYRGNATHNGKYFIVQALQCIPFMPSILQNVFGIPPEELSANVVMTDDYAGRHDLFQIGTTIVADPYFDLKTLGVVIMLIVCGIVYFWVDAGICFKGNTKAITIIVLILLASMAVYIPRSTLMAQFKNFIPILVLFWMNLIVGKKNRIIKIQQ